METGVGGHRNEHGEGVRHAAEFQPAEMPTVVVGDEPGLAALGNDDQCPRAACEEARGDLEDASGGG